MVNAILSVVDQKIDQDSSIANWVYCVFRNSRKKTACSLQGWFWGSV